MKTFKRPNVLLIYTDQQRLDTLSCNVDDCPIETKNINSIAKEGVCFTKCFVQSPICQPSRMSFLSGRYCSDLGVGTNGVPFPEKDAKPINQILKDYGYETAQLGKIHFQAHAKRDARNVYPNYGFDRFIVSDEPGCYDDPYTKWVEQIAPEQLAKVRTALPPAALYYGKPEYSFTPRNTHEPYDFEGAEDLTHSAFVATETSRYLRERTPNKPFFAIAGFYAPHTPINPPKSCVERVDMSKVKLPTKIAFEDTMPELRNLSDDEWRKIVQYYFALTLHVDDCIGEILNTLEETGAYNDTIIIFTSDHGEYLGDHGKIQKGMPGYDCITNIPMIIRYPEKIKSNVKIDGLIESIDMFPTILDYCGIQTPTNVQGKSLKPFLESKVKVHREDVMTENFIPNGLKETSIRTDYYRYYCNTDGEEILTDLNKDPNEIVNVVNNPEYTSVLSEMRKRMIMRIQRAAYSCREQDAEY